jgi:hypothetical protein
MRIAVPLTAAALAWLTPRAIAACSCVAPSVRLLSPLDEDAAPLNARIVWLEPLKPQGKVVVRTVGGKSIAGKRTSRRGMSITTVVFEPSKPLPADTRFEIASVDRSEHPKTLVFGTFATSSKRDDDAPDKTKVTNVVLKKPRGLRPGMCDPSAPFVEIHGVEKDILYALWVSEPNKAANTKVSPKWVLKARRPTLVIGKNSLCSWGEAAMPDRKGAYELAVATVDAAGNLGPIQKRSLKLPGKKKQKP